MKSLLYNSLKWLAHNIAVAIVSTAVLSYLGLAVVDWTIAKGLTLSLAESMQSPTPLWVTTILLVIVYLLSKTTKSHSSTTPKPDLSKLSEEHENVLVSLSIVPEATAKDISSAIKKTEELVIHALESLEQKLLVRKVHQASVYQTGWVMTKHGRKYLADRNML